MIWREPTKPNGYITEYDLCFGKCGDDMSDCLTLVSSGDHFLVTSDYEREQNVDVQVYKRGSPL